MYLYIFFSGDILLLLKEVLVVVHGVCISNLWKKLLHGLSALQFAIMQVCGLRKHIAVMYVRYYNFPEDDRDTRQNLKSFL